MAPNGYEVTAPTVSVVVTTYHRPEQLSLCLEAIHRQILSPHEIIVTQDCDDDPDTTWLARCHGVRLVSHPRTLDSNGVGIWDEPQTVNLGVGAATGAAVLVMQDDLIIPPDFLLWLARGLDPGTILYPVLEYVGHDRFTERDLDSMLRLTHIPDAEPRFQRFTANSRSLLIPFTEAAMAEGLVWAFPRAAWIPIDPHFVGCGFGEQDWAIRQRLRGYRLCIHPYMRGWLRNYPGVVHPTEAELEQSSAHNLYMQQKWGEIWTVAYGAAMLPPLPFPDVPSRVLELQEQYHGSR